MKEILIWIFFGGLAGFTSKWILPAKHGPQGCLAYSLIGVFGAIVGGFIGKYTIGSTSKVPDYLSLITAIIGAVLFSAIFRMVKNKKNIDVEEEI